MRLERMAWVPVIVMTLGCQQADRKLEQPARTPPAVQREATVPESAPAPPSPEPVGPTGTPSVRPLAARGPAPTLRIGRRAQADGRILDSDQSDMFMTYDTIQFSIGVPEVAAGAMARLSIQDQRTNQEAWQAQRSATTGDSFLTFELGPGTLSPGDYVGVVTVDDRGVTQHAFKVSSR